MRKILALLLVTALIPFLTGCRIDGLWGYDDDDTIPASVSTTNNIAPVIKVPVAANGLLASSLSNTNASSLECSILLADGTTWEPMTASYTATDVLFTLSRIYKATELYLDAGNKMKFRFSNTGVNGLPVVIEFAACPVTPATTGATAETYSYAIELNFAGDTIGVKVAVSTDTVFTANTTSFGTFTDQGTVPPTSNTTEADKYYTIASLSYSTNNSDFIALSQNPAAPTDINQSNLQGLYFKVTFSEAITNTGAATFSITADNLKTTAKTTITALGGNATKTWANDSKSVVICVSANTMIEMNATYSLILNNFSGVAGTKTLLANPKAYFIDNTNN